jgi:archaellum biogenesis ATPase FlaH
VALEKEREDGQFVCNTACICGKSSDAMSVYVKTDGTVDAYCRSGFCDRESGYISNEELEKEGFDLDSVSDFEERPEKTDFSFIENLGYRGWRERRVTKTVHEKYNVRSEVDDNNKPIAHYYPVTRNGVIVGYKKREFPKSFVGYGDTKATTELFGQAQFEKGGKFLVLVSGEMDAMAMAQVLKQDKNEVTYWNAVVSFTCGDEAIMKQLRANFEWINSFEKVIIMLDSDESAQQYVEPIAKALSPGKAHIAKLPNGCKDANEALINGLSGQLKNAFWKAERYSPSAVIGSGDTWDALVQRAKWEKVSLPPFATELQEMLNGGVALGEITTIAAASSVGKTTVVNELLYHFVMNTDYKVGVLSLESDTGELIENLLSIHIGKKLSTMNDEEKIDFYQNDEYARQAHWELTHLPDGSDRFLIVEHQGAVVDNGLNEKLEYLVALGCKCTIIDPITLGLSGEDNSGVDSFMSWLLRFVKANMISHINVAHIVKKSSGSVANSRGGEISEEMIKGSGSQFQVSMNNILLMRDKVHDDPVVRNTTRVVVSKARRTGVTGSAGFWYYNGDTARLEAGRDPDDEDGYSEDEQLFRDMGAFDNSVPEKAAKSFDNTDDSEEDF